MIRKTNNIIFCFLSLNFSNKYAIPTNAKKIKSTYLFVRRGAKLLTEVFDVIKSQVADEYNSIPK
jgi:hypothetical protein